MARLVLTALCSVGRSVGGGRQAIIGVCRDLRGVTSATQNRKSYCALFELLYPQYFPVFVRAAETWYDSPEVTTALLKFLQVRMASYREGGENRSVVWR